MENPEKFWNRIASKYDKQTEKVYQQAYLDTIYHTKKFLKSGDTVIDFGCGTGSITTELSDSAKQILANDISPEMILIARRKAAENNLSNIEYKVTDIFNPAYAESSANVILAFNVLHFLDNPAPVLDRIHNLLKPSGIFLSVTDCLGEKKSLSSGLKKFLAATGVLPPMKHFTMRELENMIIERHFTLIEARNLHDTPPNYFIACRKAGLT